MKQHAWQIVYVNGRHGNQVDGMDLINAIQKLESEGWEIFQIEGRYVIYAKKLVVTT